MTVPDSSNKITYTGTGATATYAYTDIKTFDEADLAVFVTKLSDLTITELVLNTDYTVTGVGIAAGGNVVLVNASQAWLDGSGFLTSSYSITIKRIMEIVQETSITSQGQNNPEYVEKQFDRSIMIDQQQQDQIDRSLKLPETEVGTAANTTLPDLETRKNTIAAYDADGNPTTAVLSSVGASVTASYITLATDSSLTNERVLTGTANQITVTDNGAGGTVVLSIPSNATPTISTLTVSTLTAGRVAIVGTSGLLEDDGGLTYAKATDILTVAGAVKLPAASVPGVLADGQIWNDSTQKCFVSRNIGMTEYPRRCIYSQVGSVTVANTAVKTTLLTTPSFGTNVIPANYITAGRIFEFTITGNYGITGTPDFLIQVDFGGTGTAAVHHTAVTGNGTNFIIKAIIAFSTVGASAAARATAVMTGAIANGGASLVLATATTQSIDTTAQITFAVNMTWGTASASNTITVYGVTCEVIG